MEQIPSNLPEQIDIVRNMEINYDTLHPKANIYDNQSGRTIIIPYESLMNKYKDFLSGLIISEELTEEQKRNYWYKPKTVSFEIYGTTELWDVILILNNAFNIVQFTPNVLKYYDPENLKEYINEIMILEGMYDMWY